MTIKNKTRSGTECDSQEGCGSRARTSATGSSDSQPVYAPPTRTASSTCWMAKSVSKVALELVSQQRVTAT